MLLFRFFFFFFYFFHVILSLSLSRSLSYSCLFPLAAHALLLSLSFLAVSHSLHRRAERMKSIHFKCFLWSEYRNGILWCLNDLVEFLPRFIFVAVNRHTCECECENKTMQKWMIEMMQWRETNPRTIVFRDMFQSWLTAKGHVLLMIPGKTTHIHIQAQTHRSMQNAPISLYTTQACVYSNNFFSLFSWTNNNWWLMVARSKLRTKCGNFGHELAK